MLNRFFAFMVAGFASCVLGCYEQQSEKKQPQSAEPKTEVAKPVREEAKKVPVGPNVLLEVDGDTRRVWVSGEICKREGPLEQFLCRAGTKEHEAVVSAEIDARDLHKALLLARAEPGSPVTFQPVYKPASGSTIRVEVVFNKDGKKVNLRAQDMIRDMKSGKALSQEWVFAGSRMVPDPLDKNKPPYYMANDGDVICVSNFETALLDLPIKSSKDNADVQFEAFTENIPELKTKVAIMLEVIPPKSMQP